MDPAPQTVVDGTPQGPEDPIGPPPGEMPAEAGLADLEDLGGSLETTELDEVRDDLEKDVEAEPCVIPIPLRPGYELVFDASIPGPLMEKWTKSAKSRKALDGVDELKLALLVIANKNVELRKDGRPVTEGGRPLNVRSTALHTILKVGRPFEAVQKLLGSDGHVIQMAREVAAAAGWSDGLVQAAENPTQGP